MSIILPIGLSFHTFQSLSYVIEVYRGKYRAEKNLGIYSLYVMFFPQLVAGPIERPGHLIPQFKKEQFFDYKRVFEGIQLMCWGFFKKVVIADRLATVVNMVYNNVTDYTGIPLIVATIFFAFQIFCDFSGYSDIAMGSAKIMGIDLTQNFKRPYLSRSIREFWRRWHISLMNWFVDYIYIPLGGNRVKTYRLFLNLIIVFLISGLWHGANWTFIIWGALNGFYLIFSIMTSKLREKISSKLGIMKLPVIYAAMQMIVTFILVNLGWIFFRANSISDALYILTHLFSNWSLSFPVRHGGVGGWPGFFTVILLVLLLIVIQLIQEFIGVKKLLSTKPFWVRGIIYLVIILVILLIGVFGSAPFIYFQF